MGAAPATGSINSGRSLTAKRKGSAGEPGSATWVSASVFGAAPRSQIGCERRRAQIAAEERHWDAFAAVAAQWEDAFGVAVRAHFKR